MGGKVGFWRETGRAQFVHCVNFSSSLQLTDIKMVSHLQADTRKQSFSAFLHKIAIITEIIYADSFTQFVWYSVLFVCAIN